MSSRQQLTFAGVNAHHTNGLAERRIRSLQDLARAMLIHQHRRWKIEIMKAELSKTTVGNIEGELFSLQASFPTYAGLPEEDPIYGYKATSDPDTMYHHQAMKQPDAEDFRKAMKKEWIDQLQNGNFTLIHRSKVPEGATILPAVWQMRRKRDIKTRGIKKYKARLNIDGSSMKQGVHYDQTYAPVASWDSIRTLLIMSTLHRWHTKQIDYVLAFPQAPVEREISMQIPRGLEVEGGNTKDFVLQLTEMCTGRNKQGECGTNTSPTFW
jgi:hypothetical protein